MAKKRSKSGRSQAQVTAAGRKQSREVYKREMAKEAKMGGRIKRFAADKGRHFLKEVATLRPDRLIRNQYLYGTPGTPRHEKAKERAAKEFSGGGKRGKPKTFRVKTIKEPGRRNKFLGKN